MKTILIVDDASVNRFLLKAFIQKIFHNNEVSIQEASNGLLAIQMQEENLYDLILMDIKMPIMNGIEASHRILTNILLRLLLALQVK